MTHRSILLRCRTSQNQTLPVLAFRLSIPKSSRTGAHHSEFGSPDSSRVRKPIDLCGSFGRIPSTLGLVLRKNPIKRFSTNVTMLQCYRESKEQFARDRPTVFILDEFGTPLRTQAASADFFGETLCVAISVQVRPSSKLRGLTAFSRQLMKQNPRNLRPATCRLVGESSPIP